MDKRQNVHIRVDFAVEFVVVGVVGGVVYSEWRLTLVDGSVVLCKASFENSFEMQ